MKIRLIASTVGGPTARMIALILVVVLTLTLSAPARAEADALTALAIAGAAAAVLIIIVFLVIASSQSGKGEASAPTMLACVEEATPLRSCWALLSPGPAPETPAPVAGPWLDPQS